MKRCGGVITGELAEQLWQQAEAARERRAVSMPTERDALLIMTEAYHRLHELGWQDAIYCPKDGTIFDSISAGSTGIHECYYDGQWPDGSWWLHDDEDVWPAYPILWRARTS